jgi:hypothetical protein
MTRDEAANIVFELAADTSQATGFVDTLAALGVLKFDEPKSPWDRAVDALFERAEGGMLTPRHALAAIISAGLKIVEK